MMSDTGYNLDPIAAAKRDVARSKEIAASVADELKQHKRWFESYVAEEKRSRKRHARLIGRQQMLLRRQERRQRTIRFLRRTVLVLAIGMRAVFRFLSKGGASALMHISDLLSESAVWIAKQARTLAAATLALIRSATSRIGAKSRAIALACIAAGTPAAASTVQKASALAGAARQGATRGASWLGVKSRAVGLACIATGTDAWSRRKPRVLRLSLLAWSGIGLAWIKASGSALEPKLRRAGTDAWAWLVASARNLQLKLQRARSSGWCWMQVTARDLRNWFIAQMSAAIPLLRGYKKRAFGLMAGISGQAGHRLESAKHAARTSAQVLRSRAARVRSLRLPNRGRAPRVESAAEKPEADLPAGAAAEQASLQHEEATPSSSTAVICTEPWRRRLPAVEMSWPDGFWHATKAHPLPHSRPISNSSQE
jgi:hypothetical protein